MTNATQFLIECRSRNLFPDGDGLAGGPASWGSIPTPLFDQTPYETLRKQRTLVKTGPEKDRTMTRSEPGSVSQLDSKRDLNPNDF